MSHAYSDNLTCRLLASALEERGYNVWLDLAKDYDGQVISDVVREALIASDAMIIVLSDAALQSKWVREEYAFFRDHGNRARRIVSVKISDCQLRAEPRLALDPDQRPAPDLEDLAAIDATHMSVDDVIARIGMQLNRPLDRWGRVKLSTMAERDLEELIRDLIPAIYDSASIGKPEQSLLTGERRVVPDMIVSNSYTLFPGRYIIELKRWNNLSDSSGAVTAAVRQLIANAQALQASLEHADADAGTDEEVFAFLFTPSDVSRTMRQEARRANVRIFDGQRLVRLLRDNGFDVEL